MTSFARQSNHDERGSFVWEIRTLNHRYLEIDLRCPESFRHQEMVIREMIRKFLSRGKVEAHLKFISGSALPIDFLLNTALLKKLSEAEKIVQTYFPNAIINAADILSWKDVLQTVDAQDEFLNQVMLDLLSQTLTELVAIRHNEGKGIRYFIEANCKKMMLEAAKIEKRLPEILTIERQRIQQRLLEVQNQFDEQRLEQEMVIWAQRADVAEELQRLKAHLEEVCRIVQKGGTVGRRLDFLMQELNREANTLSSKSLDANMTQSAVEMKVLIEQMREQVQNVE